ncbi:MAG TPA: hypothetical protein VGH28_06335 [Polyangiaceae bacterium]|jgi:hypothetical protein
MKDFNSINQGNTVQMNMQTFVLQGEFNALVQTDSTQGCAYLTPESLMAYCQSRLQGIDTQVNEAFAQQQQSNYAQQILGQLASSPAFQVPTDKIGGGDDAAAAVQAVKDAIEAAKSKLDPNSPAYASLDSYEKNTIDAIDTSKDISPDTFNNTIVGGLSTVQKDLNSSSELSMIGLQSLMSQRQSAIQMCTNLIQSLGDQLNKIAENIGH